MLRGDKLLAKRRLLLVYLYEQGAVAYGSAVEYRDLRAAIDVDDADFTWLTKSLLKLGVVKRVQSGRKLEGNSGYSARYWLSFDGFEEASRIVSEVHDQAERSAKGPIGFPEPGDKGSSEEEV